MVITKNIVENASPGFTIQMTTQSPKNRLSPKKASSPTKNEETRRNSSSFNSSMNSRPSAEDLVDLERELQKLIARKLQADTNLAKMEIRLYDLETEYFNETQAFGNLIHGIEGYLGLPTTSNSTNNSSIRRITANGPLNNSTSSLSTISSSASLSLNPQQRLFSATSTSYPKFLALAGRLPEAIANGYVPPNSTSESVTSSEITTIKGLKNKDSGIIKKSSPKKPSSSSNSNKNKKSASEGSEWQAPAMKSSRKK